MPSRTQAALANALDVGGYDEAEEAAAALFAANNRNGDPYLCVMSQVLPNDASGNDEYFVMRDNHANASEQ